MSIPSIITFKANSGDNWWDDLPTKAAEKVRAWRDLDDEESAIHRDARETIETHVRPNLMSARANLERMEWPEGRYMPRRKVDGDPAFERAQEAVKKWEAEVSRCEARMKVAAERAAPAREFLRNLPDYLAEVPRAWRQPHRLPVEAKLLRHETPRDAVERLRRRGRELEADARRVEAACRPAADAKTQARAEIEALAQRGRPDVTALREPGLDGKIRWPITNVIDHRGNMTPGIILVTADAPAIFAAMFKDQLIALVEREVDDYAEQADEMSDFDRAAKLAEIARDRLAVEREEEAVIMAAEADGIEIPRRREADPRALLGLCDEAAPRELRKYFPLPHGGEE